MNDADDKVIKGFQSFDASQHKELHFLVTAIGCGIAGFEPEDIAPLFDAAKDMENVSLPESFWDVL